MKILLRQVTMLFALIALPLFIWAQCPSCPTSGATCLAPFCCIATGGVNTVDNCLANGANVIRISYSGAVVSSGGDISGVHFCMPGNTSLSIDPNVTVDNGTCFTPSTNGNTVSLAGTTFELSGPAGLSQINALLGLLPDGVVVNIQDALAILPVNLISFTGKESESGIQLDWATASETNNDYFLLERSTDAKVFEYVTSIPSQGDGTQQQQYQFMDKDAKPGINYYRLWQYDVDGTKADLGIIEVNNRSLSNGPITITPNPVVIGSRISLNAANLNAQEDVEFTLVNTMGQTWTLTPEGSELLIPSQLKNGLYYLVITQSSERELLPLVLVE